MHSTDALLPGAGSRRQARTLLLVGALLFAGLLVACEGDDEDPEETTTSTATGTATTPATEESTDTETPPADATQAIPESDASFEAYSALVEQVTAAFPDVTLIEDTGAFEVGGGEIVGEGRRVLVFGNAADLPSYSEVAEVLRGILEDDGWTEDEQYAADGPTGTLSVWTKAEDLAILSAGASPQDPSACPADQVIAVCLDSLEPAEVNVQGSISVAVRGQ